MTRRCARSALTFFLIASYLAACGIAPARNVLPYPDHVLAALSVGDRIEVDKTDGSSFKGTVTDVTAQTIVIDGTSHDVDDIRSISLRSFGVPANPCDDERPLGCSVPRLARIASDAHDRFADYFGPSCRAHDYCYRYGALTYGFDRSDCDEQFLDAMQSQCGGHHILDLEARAECLLAARHFHSAVVQHGEQSFLGTSGRYCEYAGPRSVVVDR